VSDERGKEETEGECEAGGGAEGEPTSGIHFTCFTLLHWYKSPNNDATRASDIEAGVHFYFTCFNGTKVQILTLDHATHGFRYRGCGARGHGGGGRGGGRGGCGGGR
jgi:hypothetical protein